MFNLYISLRRSGTLLFYMSYQKIREKTFPQLVAYCTCHIFEIFSVFTMSYHKLHSWKVSANSHFQNNYWWITLKKNICTSHNFPCWGHNILIAKYTLKWESNRHFQWWMTHALLIVPSKPWSVRFCFSWMNFRTYIYMKLGIYLKTSSPGSFLLINPIESSSGFLFTCNCKIKYTVYVRLKLYSTFTGISRQIFNISIHF
jgi:hypothetical protein